MARWLTIGIVFVTAALFAWAIPLTRLFGAFQPLSVALSIMTAAVFVRLNRGMPTFEWKSIEPEERSNLTSHIFELSKEYGWIIGLNAVGLLVLLTLASIGEDVVALWPLWARRAGSAAVAAVSTLCAVRMGYVVWRDIDIVRLQKVLIDGSATRESQVKQEETAAAKVSSIRASNLRRIEVPAPKGWDD